MPSVSLQATTRVERLAALWGEMLANHRDNLRIAREIGDLLRHLPRKERAAEARRAGITKSLTTLDDYVAVAERWETVQHAGAESIRQAMKVLRVSREAGKALPLPFTGRCINREGKHGRPGDDDGTGFCEHDG